MFTGIVECLGEIEAKEEQGTNIHFWIRSEVSDQLKIDQSVAHDGVCLTVVELRPTMHRVTAIDETLSRSNLKTWNRGTAVNIERCMPADGRFDGHVVQGHVDTTAQLESITEEDGSWRFAFQLSKKHAGLIVEKGSITINGVSLTVAGCGEQSFEVAIIPYTYEHTSFGNLHTGDQVNIEFDIIGKYVHSMLVSRGL